MKFPVDRTPAIGLAAGTALLVLTAGVAWWNGWGSRGATAALVAATTLAAVLLLLAAVQLTRESECRREVENERDQFFALTRELVCVMSLDGRIERVNPAWTSALGWESHEVPGRHLLDFVQPDDRETVRHELARLIRGEASAGVEIRFQTRDGSPRWLQWSARTGSAANVILAIARDVTGAREADERIQALNAEVAQRTAQLESANREFESFSYSVSHDLRAPLRHIDGFANMLTKRIGAEADGDARRYVTIISKAAKQMGMLIDDLLSFSRIGRATLRPESFRHDQLITEVIANARFCGAEHPIGWEVSPLPDVRADVAMLRQVWTNLIDNAVKFSSRTPRPRIEIGHRTDAGSGDYVFFVRDNGVGFDMAYADKLFGVFQRLHGPHEFEGTGIGLANVRRIIARHGGRTWAESRVGEGATFYFSLPGTQSPSPAYS